MSDLRMGTDGIGIARARAGCRRVRGREQSTVSKHNLLPALHAVCPMLGATMAMIVVLTSRQRDFAKRNIVPSAESFTKDKTGMGGNAKESLPHHLHHHFLMVSVRTGRWTE